MVLCLAGAICLLAGFLYPPGRPGGVYPVLTAWGPLGVVVAVGLAWWATATAIGIGALLRPAVTGEVVFESDGGWFMLALAVLPLAMGPAFLAGAVDQVGTHGAQGVLGALGAGAIGVVLTLGGLALGYTREEVRSDGVVLTTVSGRGFPTTERWALTDVRLEVVDVSVAPRPSWKVELVAQDGQRRVVGRARSEADARAHAARIGLAPLPTTRGER